MEAPDTNEEFRNNSLIHRRPRSNENSTEDDSIRSAELNTQKEETKEIKETKTPQQATSEEDTPQQGVSEKETKDSTFECNICLEPATEPVITLCGHLFCWPCIFEWIRSSSERPCPVCKSVVSKEKLIPLYGRGKPSTDPRNKIPERPQGQRTEPPPNGFQNQQFPFPSPFGPMYMQDSNFSFYGGFGFFPTLFGLQFQSFPPTHPTAPHTVNAHGEQVTAEQAALGRVFFFFGMLLLAYMILS